MNPEIKKRIEEVMDRTVGNFIEKLPTMLERKLEKLVAKCLGFEIDSWNNEWKVDHCNARQHTLGQYVSKKSQDIANSLIGKFDWTPEPGQVEALKRDFLRRVQDNVQQSFYKAAEQKAQKIVEQLLEETLSLEEIKAMLTEEDLYNPDIGKTKIQQAMMGEFLKKDL